MIFMDLGHANDTRIRKRHRCVPIFSQQPLHRADVLAQSEGHDNGAILEKTEQAPLGEDQGWREEFVLD